MGYWLLVELMRKYFYYLLVEIYLLIEVLYIYMCVCVYVYIQIQIQVHVHIPMHIHMIKFSTIIFYPHKKTKEENREKLGERRERKMQRKLSSFKGGNCYHRSHKLKDAFYS